MQIDSMRSILQYVHRRPQQLQQHLLKPVQSLHARFISGFSPRHFLSINDLSKFELSALVRQAAMYKQSVKTGNFRHKNCPMAGKTAAMIFSKRSTRTRISTEAAIVYFGGHPMFLGKDDIQLGVNESLHDTSKVISSMSSCIIARVDSHSDIRDLSRSSSVPVINALCDKYHPLQAIADILTISEAFDNLENLKLAWIGDANNVLNDLMIACVKLGISVSIATPANYPVSNDIAQQALLIANQSGATVELVHEPEVAVKQADVIVTDTWVSMGQEKDRQTRLRLFEGFQVSENMARRGGAKGNWRFLHCLPRKSEEVTDEVFYSQRSLVFAEAENRVYAAIATLDSFVMKNGQF